MSRSPVALGRPSPGRLPSAALQNSAGHSAAHTVRSTISQGKQGFQMSRRYSLCGVKFATATPFKPTAIPFKHAQVENRPTCGRAHSSRGKPRQGREWRVAIVSWRRGPEYSTPCNLETIATRSCKDTGSTAAKRPSALVGIKSYRRVVIVSRLRGPEYI